MKRMYGFSIVGFLLVSFLAAAADDWVNLGQKSVSDRVERDTVVVGGGRGEFSGIKVLVLGRAVQFRDMKIHFVNGGVQDVELRNVVPAGGETRTIDLKGGERRIDRIEFTYDAETARRHRGARIRVMGKR